MQLLSLKLSVSSALSIVFLSLYMRVVIQAATLRSYNSTIPAVFFFGDSIVDTGNNNYIKTLIRVNYPPYGKDFMGGKPTGRFCDGKVPSDLFVEELGIKPVLPPYLDPTLTAEDLITGVNFASGGAGYDPFTSQFVSVLSLSDQLALFKEYTMKLQAIVGEVKTKTILRDSLFILLAGSNDITNTYFGTTIRRSHYDVASYTDFMLNFGSTFVQDLYRQGARRIGVLSVPPMGCVPAIRTLKGGPERNCADDYNQMAQLFNSKLAAELHSLNTKLPGAKMIYIDIYNLPLEVIHNPKKYGFNIGNIGCCGTGTVEVAYLCKIACANVNDYVFWDSFHLTEKAYRFIVHEILTQQIKNFID